MFPFTQTVEQQARVQLTPLTAQGNPTTIDGNIQFEVLEGDGTIELGDNATQAIVKPGTANTVSRFRVYADADLDAGEERMIEEELVVTTVSAEASTLNASVTLEDLPPVTP